jgi:hypothetical protein
MPWRNCIVSFNAGGLPQRAEVDAESVYEAVINALKQWRSRRQREPHRHVPVEVKLEDGRVFTVTADQAINWLYRARGRTEDERNKKERLRYLLEGR